MNESMRASDYNKNFFIKLFSTLINKVKKEGGNSEALNMSYFRKDFTYKRLILDGFYFKLIKKIDGNISDNIFADENKELSILLLAVIDGCMTIKLKNNLAIDIHAGETILVYERLYKENIEEISLNNCMISQINIDYVSIEKHLNFYLRTAWKREMKKIFDGQKTIIVPKTKGIKDSLDYLLKSLFEAKTIFKEKQLIIQCMEEHLSFLSWFKSRRESVLCRALLIRMSQLIDEKKDLNITKLCDLFNKSQYQLNHTLAKAGYTNLEKTFIELKMLRAAILLREDNLSVAEIANMLNYTNVSKFIKQFKKRYNITPLRYKKTLFD